MKKSKKEDKFFIVCNFQSARWLMADAYKFPTYKAAEEKALEMAGNYPQSKYHVLTVVGVARAKSAPVEMIKV